jgi:photosystem II stability/assembly factor-like uncharacterized protein
MCTILFVCLARRFTCRGAAAIFISLLAFSLGNAQSWKTLSSGVDSNLRALSAAKLAGSGKIAIWAGGSHGAILRSVDSGESWSRLTAPDSAALDFRGMAAFDENSAYLMASGEGEKSRIYKTSDGGASWELQYHDANPAIFLDSIACLSATTCYALGDPIDGKFLLLKTADGVHWASLPSENLPPAQPKEGAFAASNSNLLLISESEFFVITGGFAARVLHTMDGGKSWSAAAVPIAAENASSGIFAIARSSASQLVAVGGDYANPSVAFRTAAASSPQAPGWQSPQQQPGGYRSAVVALDADTFLAAGPAGSDLSKDSGSHWQPIAGSPALNALFALDSNHVYGAGANGVVVQFLPSPR